MRTPRIFLDQSLTVGEVCSLPRDRSHYVSRVLRLREDRPLVVFNGQGGEFMARLTEVRNNEVTVEVESHLDVDRESPLKTELAIGISRGDRMDWIIQKATELGVHEISPLYTERTEVKLRGPRLEKKQEHWRQVTVSACEQCQRNRLPRLNEPVVLTDFLGNCRSNSKLIMHPDTEGRSLFGAEKPAGVTILVGPEGGFSEEEVELAKRQGFATWQLGPRVLRTETAPVAALALLQHYWGDC